MRHPLSFFLLFLFFPLASSKTILHNLYSALPEYEQPISASCKQNLFSSFHLSDELLNILEEFGRDSFMCHFICRQRV